jgi:hypothetical protein
LAEEEEQEQLARRLRDAAALLLRFHSALQRSPKDDHRCRQQQPSLVLGEEGLQACLSALAELARAVVPLLGPEDAEQAQKLERKAAARRRPGCCSPGLPDVISLDGAARLFLQVPLAAASQHLIPHVELEIAAGRLPAPEQPLEDLLSLSAFLDQLCVYDAPGVSNGRHQEEQHRETEPQQHQPQQKHSPGRLQSLQRALRAFSNAAGRKESVADYWRRAHAVWFGHADRAATWRGLDGALELLPALESVLLRMGRGDKGCQDAAKDIGQWRGWMGAANPAYIELILVMMLSFAILNFIHLYFAFTSDDNFAW